MEAIQTTIFNNTNIPTNNNIISITAAKSYKAPHETAHTQTTQPITDRTVLAAVKQKLLTESGRYGRRNYLIFCLGINLGLRCGDLLNIRVGDIFDETSKSIKDPFYIKEQKTGKIQMLSLNDDLKAELTAHILEIHNRTANTPIFQSQKTQPKVTSNTWNDTGCLTRKSYWRIMSEIGNTLGIEHFGTHTMRKTALRAIYDMYKGQLTDDGFSAIDIVQMIANHSSTSMSLRYIGITDTVKMTARKGINL